MDISRARKRLTARTEITKQPYFFGGKGFVVNYISAYDDWLEAIVRLSGYETKLMQTLRLHG